MRIYGVALLSALALSATTIDVRAQVNSQSDNSIEREIKAPPGRDVRVGIYTSIRSDCSSGPLLSIRLAVAPEHAPSRQARDFQGDQYETMLGSGGAGICRVLSGR